MSKNSNFQFAKALYEITSGLPEKDLPAAMKKFVLILQKNNKLKKIDYIIKDFISYSKKQNGIKVVAVETAKELDASTMAKIKKTFGEKSEITAIVNKYLMGGVKIKVDDMIYDASLKTQLKNLKEKLIS